jgi:hypothetical protein
MPSFVLDHERISKLNNDDIKYTKDFVIDKLDTTTVIDHGYKSYYVPELPTLASSQLVTTNTSTLPLVTSTYKPAVNSTVVSSSYSLPTSTLISSGVISSGAVLESNVPVEYFGDLEALRLLDSATLEREGLSNYVQRTTSIKL